MNLRAVKIDEAELPRHTTHSLIDHWSSKYKDSQLWEACRIVAWCPTHSPLPASSTTARSARRFAGACSSACQVFLTACKQHPTTVMSQATTQQFSFSSLPSNSWSHLKDLIRLSTQIHTPFAQYLCMVCASRTKSRSTTSSALEGNIEGDMIKHPHPPQANCLSASNK